MDALQYYQKPATKIDALDKAFDIIKREKLVLDTEHLEVIEAAERGYCTAWVELQEGFRLGKKGLPKNYRMARYYSDLMISGCLNNKTMNQNPQLLFESYRASGYLEYENQNYKLCIAHLTKAIKVMVNQMPLKKWDNQIFEVIQDVVISEQI